MVLFEETGGNPQGIEVLLVNRDTICSYISEAHPPSVKTWKKDGDQMAVVEGVKSGAHLTCPDDKVIKSVDFASFGDPTGSCGNFVVGKCTSENSEKVVAKVKSDSLHNLLSPKLYISYIIILTLRFICFVFFLFWWASISIAWERIAVQFH